MCWLDYALTTAEGEELTQTAMLAFDSFQKPEDVAIASVEQTGVTVSGAVQSYAPKREAVVAMYAYINGKVPAYCDANRNLLDTPYKTTIGDSGESQSGELVIQYFTIVDIPEGSYLLVVSKPGNTHYVITGIEVGNAPVDLTGHSNTQVSLITLIAGDIDGNGTVESLDTNTVYLSGNWLVNEPTNPLCDIDGNGTVESLDANIIYLASNWLRGDVLITLKS